MSDPHSSSPTAAPPNNGDDDNNNNNNDNPFKDEQIIREERPEGNIIDKHPDGSISFYIPQKRWKDLGFTRGRIGWNGQVIALKFEDDNELILQVKPKNWVKSYHEQMMPTIEENELNRRIKQGLPGLDKMSKDEKKMFKLQIRKILNNGLSFLAQLQPLELLLNGAPLKRPLNAEFGGIGNGATDSSAIADITMYQAGGVLSKRKPLEPTRVARIHKEGTLATVYGTVTQSSDLMHLVRKAKWKCLSCGEVTHIATKFAERPVQPKLCEFCEKKNPGFKPVHDYINAMKIHVQNAESNNTADDSDLATLPIIIFENDADHHPVGENVQVVGYTEEAQDKRSGTHHAVLIASAVKFKGRREIIITPEDIKAFKRFAGLETIFGGKACLSRVMLRKCLCAMTAPNVFCDENKKLMILVSATGAPEDRYHRGRIHLILVGPPSTGKTTLMREAIKLRQNSRLVSGKNTTGLSMTGMIIQEPDGSLSLQYGPGILAKFAILAVNEFDKLSPEQQDNLLDLMEEGLVIINKFARLREIPAPTTVIVTLNPRNNEWIDPNNITLDEIPLELTKLSRFDHISIFKDETDIQLNLKYAEEKSKYDRKGIQHNYNFLTKYIEYVRGINPKIDKEAESVINQHWAELRAKNPTLITNRQLEGFKRTAKALARLYMTDTVDEKIAEEALEFENEMLEPLLGIVKIPKRPFEQVYDAVLSIIRDKAPESIEIREATRTACEREPRLKEYMPPPYEQDQNKTFRRLCDRITQNYHVTRTRPPKPVTVKWIGETGSMTPPTTLLSSSDPSDRSDHRKDTPKLENRKIEEKSEGDDDGSDINGSIGNGNVKSAENHQKINFSEEGAGSGWSDRSDQSERRPIIENRSNSQHPTLFSQLLTTIKNPSDSNNNRQLASSAISLLYNSSVAVDFEWEQNKSNRLFQVSFKDCHGRKWAWNLAEDFGGSEVALIRAIIHVSKKYKMVLGYFTRSDSSDWKVLDQRCKVYGIESPVSIFVSKNREGEEEKKFIRLNLEGYHGYRIIDVDIGQIHAKPIIENFLGGIYDSLELDVVARARLGRGKPAGITGTNVLSQPVAKQKEYGIIDAELAMDLATCDSAIVLAILDEIARFVGMSFQQVCNSGPSTWWSHFYKDIMGVHPSPDAVKPLSRKDRKSSTRSYRGGKVIPFKPGEYEDVSFCTDNIFLHHAS